MSIEKVFNSPPQKSLYHYSSISALLGISKSERLWASNVYYQNDGKEIVYATELCKKFVAQNLSQFGNDYSDFLEQFCTWIEHFSTTAYNLFVFSLSEEESLLSQWRSYTPHGKGVSIGFSPSVVKMIAQTNSIKIAKCLYEKNEHIELINALLNKMITTFSQDCDGIDTQDRPEHQRYHPYLEQFRGDILQAFAIIKHPAFGEEKEWRLISEYFPNYAAPEIKYREGASMLIPYIELKLERWHNLPQHSQPVFFESVYLGPSPHSNLSMHALHQFLSNNKIAHHTINSNIPYREWQ